MHTDDTDQNSGSTVTEKEIALFNEIARLNNEATALRLWNNYLIGKTINEFHEKNYGKNTFAKATESTGIKKDTLYKYCQIAKELTDSDAKLLCTDKKFIVPYWCLRNFISLGREVILATFNAAQTLNEFKKNLIAIQKNNQKPSKNVDSNIDTDKELFASNLENCPSGTKSPETSNEPISNEDKKEVADNEDHADLDKNSDSSKNGDDDGVTNINKIEGRPSSSQEIEGNNSTGDDDTGNESNDGDTESALEDALIASAIPESVPTATATPKPKKTESNNSAIKQSAGASVPSNSPKSNAGGTLKDRIESKSPNDDSDTSDLVKAKEKLSALETATTLLLERIGELEKENSELKQEVEKLRSQLSEEFFDTYTEDSLQSSETEEEKELEIA